MIRAEHGAKIDGNELQGVWSRNDQAFAGQDTALSVEEMGDRV